MSEKSHHYPRLCLGVGLSCRHGGADFDTLLSLSDRSLKLTPKDNLEFHTLLKAVGKLTGREMLLNTSFNVKGQPIVNTPREAIDTFLGTGIEFLFLENTLVRRAGK